MFAVFAATDITIEAVKRASAIRIYGVIIEKPWVAAFGFIEDGF